MSCLGEKKERFFFSQGIGLWNNEEKKCFWWRALTTRRGSGSAATERVVTETLGWQLLLWWVRWAGVFRNVVSRGYWKKESFTPLPFTREKVTLEPATCAEFWQKHQAGRSLLWCKVSERGVGNVISTSCWNNGPFIPPPPLHAREEVTLELAAQNLQDVQIFLKLTETLGRQVYSIVM